MSMRKLEYEVRFVTPAFLGNAEQNGQWRTPPFKSLLRQWWRVAYAAGRKFNMNVDEMRREEGMLFGNAWLSHTVNGRDVADHKKSLVLMRLDQWKDGQETKSRWGRQEVQPNSKIAHPEVEQPVGSLLYLGYGPLEPTRTQSPGQNRPSWATTLKRNAAIQAGDAAKLSIAVPEEHAELIQQALRLIHRYGTLGGRSRNGWGSLTLTTAGDTPELKCDLKQSARPWKKALESDWPHAIGLDDNGKPLIWRIEKSYADWKTLMKDLAIIKIGLRTQFVFASGASGPHDRHWLSYPVTNHMLPAWGNLRLPNSLRFKVRPDKADAKKLRGVIFHVPCLPPQEFRPNHSTIIEIWQRVHELLDELTKLVPSRRYAMIADSKRGRDLKPGLDTVALKRITE